MGVVQSRHGSGTYIPDGPPSLGTDALSFLAALHGFTRDEMYEARRILEVGAAGLAAERATPEQIATLAEEVAEPVCVDGTIRSVFLVHDINFHRARRGGVGQSDRRLARRDGVGALLRAAPRDGGARERSRPARCRRDAPAHLPGDSRARRRRRAAAMHEHLMQASAHQAQEPAGAETLVQRRQRVRAASAGGRKGAAVVVI